MPRRELAPSAIADAIKRGDHDAELEQIDLAIRNRKRQMFRVGSKVRMVGTTNPEIDGRTGTVVKVNQKRISVKVDGMGEYHPGYLVPVSMLEIL